MATTNERPDNSNGTPPEDTSLASARPTSEVAPSASEAPEASPPFTTPPGTIPEDTQSASAEEAATGNFLVSRAPQLAPLGRDSQPPHSAPTRSRDVPNEGEEWKGNNVPVVNGNSGESSSQGRNYATLDDIRGDEPTFTLE